MREFRFGEGTRFCEGFAKLDHALRIGFAFDTLEKTLFIQEKVAGENALAVKLFEKIACGDRHLRKWFGGMGIGPGRKGRAGFGKMLRVKERETFAEFGDGGKSGRQRGRGIICSPRGSRCKQGESGERQKFEHQKSPGTKRGLEAIAAR